MLRTFRNHLLQIRPNYNVETVTAVLVRNSPVAGALWQLFGARFDPHREGDRAEAVARAEALVEKAFAAVGSLFDDEILRGVENLLRAAVRTNYYQRPERPVLAIKVDCAKVEGMVSPRPLFEIYVHSRLLEGIHLRGGKVARGGIRWSDRHDDFRTEVLGLMKTQMVKNSVIVPVGSKGGFVLKGDVPPRPALDAYLIDRYREFVSGLLDVTDNLVDGNVIHPPGRRPARRARSVPRRRRRQGHGAPVRHGQPRLGAVRLLAGRRLRLRRQQRLRPQEGGDHGARGVGVREAPLPQPRRGRAVRALHDGRDRGHVGGRVRERRPPEPHRRGWSPRSTTCTSSSTRARTRRRASPSASGCSACRARRGGTTGRT